MSGTGRPGVRRPGSVRRSQTAAMIAMIAMAPQMPTTAQDRPARSSSGTKDTAAISTGTTGM